MRNSIESFAKDNIRRQVQGVRDKGFFREWREILWRHDQENPSDNPEDNLPREEFLDDIAEYRPDFSPDMFLIDAKKQMVYFYEIEDTHPLTKQKMQRMDLWIEAVGDCLGWSARVIVTDRYGLNHRLVLAYEHWFGPEPIPDDEIEFAFPEVFKPTKREPSLLILVLR